MFDGCAQIVGDAGRIAVVDGTAVPFHDENGFGRQTQLLERIGWEIATRECAIDFLEPAVITSRSAIRSVQVTPASLRREVITTSNLRPARPLTTLPNIWIGRR